MSEDRPLVVVSSDTHVGPLLQEQLRGYCPKKHLEAFDNCVARDKVFREYAKEASPQYFKTDENGDVVRAHRNALIPGHHDVGSRLEDMNYDGVAAEVVFHGSVNDEPIPFTNMGDPKHQSTFKNNAPDNPELDAAGRHIYNEWLADFCSVEPERHAGLAHIPIWDVEASVREMHWARSAGLRGVNFPSPQSWLPGYNNQQWEPLWAAAQDLDLPLVMHVGKASDDDYSGVDGMAIYMFESALIYGRRIVPWLVYGGVFERYPQLKVVITETAGYWWPSLMSDLDSNYSVNNDLPLSRGRMQSSYLRDVCPKLPSQYCSESLFAGASFMNHVEAESASRDGTYRNFMWGSDYPHAEGTFCMPDDRQDTPMTHLALRFAFNGLPEEHTRAMAGENAMRIYGLDSAKLSAVSSRINALSVAAVNEPIVPPEGSHVTTLAFREHGIWH
jgi:predicted TIM-barrel fold metal-dependent hydrolase